MAFEFVFKSLPNSNHNKSCEPDCKVGRYLVWQIVFKSLFHLSSSNFSHGHVNVEENQCVPYKQASDKVHCCAKSIDWWIIALYWDTFAFRGDISFQLIFTCLKINQTFVKNPTLGSWERELTNPCLTLIGIE